jgi:hypothetical protein
MDANLEFTWRIVEVCYETSRAIVRYEGLAPEIGADVLVVEKDGKPPAGLTEREQFIWRLGYSAGRESWDDQTHE